MSPVSALDEGGRSAPRPGRFTPGKETRYPLYRGLGGPQGQSRCVRKTSTPPPWFDPRTFHSVAVPTELPRHTLAVIMWAMGVTNTVYFKRSLDKPGGGRMGGGCRDPDASSCGKRVKGRSRATAVRSVVHLLEFPVRFEDSDCNNKCPKRSPTCHARCSQDVTFVRSFLTPFKFCWMKQGSQSIHSFFPTTGIVVNTSFPVSDRRSSV